MFPFLKVFSKCQKKEQKRNRHIRKALSTIDEEEEEWRQESNFSAGGIVYKRRSSVRKITQKLPDSFDILGSGTNQFFATLKAMIFFFAFASIAVIPALVSFSDDPIYKNGGIADFSAGSMPVPIPMCQ